MSPLENEHCSPTRPIPFLDARRDMLHQGIARPDGFSPHIRIHHISVPTLSHHLTACHHHSPPTMAVLYRVPHLPHVHGIRVRPAPHWRGFSTYSRPSCREETGGPEAMPRGSTTSSKSALGPNSTVRCGVQKGLVQRDHCRLKESVILETNLDIMCLCETFLKSSDNISIEGYK